MAICNRRFRCCTSIHWTGELFNFPTLVTWRSFITSRAQALAGDAAGQGAGPGAGLGLLVTGDCVPGVFWWETFQWGFHGLRVKRSTTVDGGGGWGIISGGRIFDFDQILVHTHIYDMYSMGWSQWSMGKCYFVWLFSSSFTAIELGRAMVEFYNIYQICSPFSGWCVITKCVSFSVLWLN